MSPCKYNSFVMANEFNSTIWPQCCLVCSLEMAIHGGCGTSANKTAEIIALMSSTEITWADRGEKGTSNIHFDSPQYVYQVLQASNFVCVLSKNSA